MGGPADCLQYYTATSGTVASFNYPIGTSSIASATTSKYILFINKGQILDLKEGLCIQFFLS